MTLNEMLTAATEGKDIGSYWYVDGSVCYQANRGEPHKVKSVNSERIYQVDKVWYDGEIIVYPIDNPWDSLHSSIQYFTEIF